MESGGETGEEERWILKRERGSDEKERPG